MNRLRALPISRTVSYGMLSWPAHALRLKSPFPPVRLARVTQESHAVKRRFARVALPKGMLVAWQHSGSRSVSRVATLGLGGLFITTADPVPIGSVVKIVFDVPGGEVRARAIVKNIKAGKGMAVAFIEMTYECRARLGQLLKKLA